MFCLAWRCMAQARDKSRTANGRRRGSDCPPTPFDLAQDVGTEGPMLEHRTLPISKDRPFPRTANGKQRSPAGETPPIARGLK